MKIKRYMLSAAAMMLILMLPMLESCRTDLCYNHFPVADLTLSWEQEWERDYGMAYNAGWDADLYGLEYNELRPTTPEWVSVIRYSQDGNSSNDKYLSPSGGQLVLTSGYDDSFLFYNGDTEYIILSDMASLTEARATATARTRASLTYMTERHPQVRSMNPPDILYSAFVNYLPNIAIHEAREVPIRLKPLVFTYLIRYEFEEGVEHINLARGAIGGMAESVYLRDGKTSDEAAIILFDCEVKDYGCEAQVRSFGVPSFPDKYYGRGGYEALDLPYTLNLEVMLTNGKVLEFNYDIADQLKNQPRGGVITIKGLRIEAEQNSTPISGGFDVDLSGWGEVDVDLPLDPPTDDTN